MAVNGVATSSKERFCPPLFPKTRCSLWDKTSKGQPVVLHLSHYRKPRVCIPEKILKIVQHQYENYGQTSQALLGTLVVDDDGEGVQVQVDRLDLRTNIPSGGSNLASGIVLIQLKVTNNTASERAASINDHLQAIQHLQSRCCSKDTIELSSFFVLRGWVTFYSNNHTSVAHVDFDMVTVGTVLRATPITPVPIVLTALSKNLACPRNLSSIQETPKTGYLTMDQTRKVLLVLESDPKAATLPIVGIWVSGVYFVHHPFVWASCLRYMCGLHLQDRVCSIPDEFLLILYPPQQAKPEFYQCEASSCDISQQFQLSSGSEVINVDKSLTSPGSNTNFVEVDMEPVQSGLKMETFTAAVEKHGTGSKMDIGQEDLVPRCVPKPHLEKLPIFRPVVPDLSVCIQAEPPHSNWLSHIKQNGGYNTQQQQAGPYLAMEDTPRPVLPTQIRFPASNPATPAGRPQLSKLYSQFQVRPLLSAGHIGQILPTSPLDIFQAPPQASSESDQSLAYSTPLVNRTQVNTAESSNVCSPINANANLVDSPKITGLNSCDCHHVPTSASKLNQNLSGSPPSLIPKQGRTAIVQQPRCNHLPSQYGAGILKLSPSCTKEQCCHRGAAKSVTEEASSPCSCGKSDHENSRQMPNRHIFGNYNESFGSREASENYFCPNVSSSKKCNGEDSGLGITPSADRSSSQEQAYVQRLSSVPQSPATKTSWDQIPAEFRAMLLEQNEKLIQLQQQVEFLKAQQALREHHTTHVSRDHEVFVGEKSPNVKYNSVAVNTVPMSELVSFQEKCCCAANGSRPREATQQRPGFSPQKQAVLSPSVSDEKMSRDHYLRQTIPVSEPAAITTIGVVASDAQSTNNQSLQASSRFSRDDISQEDFEAAEHVPRGLNYTANSSHSCQVLSVDDTVSDRSQHLASEDNQDETTQFQESNSFEDEEDISHSLIHYNQLMNTIQNFLTSRPAAEDENLTLKSKLEDTSCSASAWGLSSLSMRLDPGSDNWKSTDINTLAMKYLSDEQLSRVAKLHHSSPSASPQCWLISDHMYSAAHAAATPDVSCLGLSPYDVTVGTRMYLQKHGLLGNDVTVVDLPELDRDLCMRTDFSIFTNGTTASRTYYSSMPTVCGKSDCIDDVCGHESYSQHSMPTQDMTTKLSSIKTMDIVQHEGKHKEAGTPRLLIKDSTVGETSECDQQGNHGNTPINQKTSRESANRNNIENVLDIDKLKQMSILY